MPLEGDSPGEPCSQISHQIATKSVNCSFSFLQRANGPETFPCTDNTLYYPFIGLRPERITFGSEPPTEPHLIPDVSGHKREASQRGSADGHFGPTSEALRASNGGDIQNRKAPSFCKTEGLHRICGILVWSITRANILKDPNKMAERIYRMSQLDVSTPIRFQPVFNLYGILLLLCLSILVLFSQAKWQSPLSSVPLVASTRL